MVLSRGRVMACWLGIAGRFTRATPACFVTSREAQRESGQGSSCRPEWRAAAALEFPRSDELTHRRQHHCLLSDTPQTSPPIPPTPPLHSALRPHRQIRIPTSNPRNPQRWYDDRPPCQTNPPRLVAIPRPANITKQLLGKRRPHCLVYNRTILTADNFLGRLID